MTDLNLEELKETAQNAESLTIFTKTSAPRVQVLAEDLLALIDRIEELEADIQRVRELHPPRPNSTSALYPTPLCACGKDYPCPTIQTLGDQK